MTSNLESSLVEYDLREANYVMVGFLNKLFQGVKPDPSYVELRTYMGYECVHGEVFTKEEYARIREAMKNGVHYYKATES